MDTRIVPEWQENPVIHRLEDDSYVIRKNNLPCHIPNEGEWAAQWAEVEAWARDHPQQVTEEQIHVDTPVVL